MTLNSFPVALQNTVQSGMLEHKFLTGLESNLVYRSIAEVETILSNTGETITKTRAGLKAPVTTPISDASNTNLDNGLTPVFSSDEQYTIALNQYGSTTDVNFVTQQVGIANRVMRNAYEAGRQASQSLERLAKAALYTASLAGNTRVTLTSTTTAVKVDDITGFTQVFSSTTNSFVPVSSSNTLMITMNGNAYLCIGASPDGTNVSSNPFGASGTLTLATAAATGDAVSTTVNGVTTGTAVVALTASTVLRPNGRDNTSRLTAGDKLTMANVLDAVAQLRNNAVPVFDQENGTYGLFLDPTSARQLFADPDFKQAFQGQGGSPVFKKGIVMAFLGCTLYPSTEAPIYTFNNQQVHNPIVVGEGALIEGRMENMTGSGIVDVDNDLVYEEDGIVMVVRPPIDRLSQIVAQSWYSILGYCVPTDITATQTIIPTASNAYYKRFVTIQHTA